MQQNWSNWNSLVNSSNQSAGTFARHHGWFFVGPCHPWAHGPPANVKMTKPNNWPFVITVFTQELSKKNNVAQTIRFLGFSDATFNKYLFEQLTASLRHQVCHRQLKAIIAGSALQEVKAQSLDDDDVQLLAKERSWGTWGENLRIFVGRKKEGEKQLIWRWWSSLKLEINIFWGAFLWVCEFVWCFFGFMLNCDSSGGGSVHLLVARKLSLFGDLVI